MILYLRCAGGTTQIEAEAVRTYRLPGQTDLWWKIDDVHGLKHLVNPRNVISLSARKIVLEEEEEH